MEEGLAFAAPPPGMGAIAIMPIDPAAVAQIDHAAHEHAERVAREGAQLAQTLGLDAEPVAVSDNGGVGETILNVARERAPAVIVIGSWGLGGLLARLQGSTASHLLRHATCPVLAVHPEAAERSS